MDADNDADDFKVLVEAELRMSELLVESEEEEEDGESLSAVDATSSVGSRGAKGAAAAFGPAFLNFYRDRGLKCR